MQWQVHLSTVTSNEYSTAEQTILVFQKNWSLSVFEFFQMILKYSSFFFFFCVSGQFWVEQNVPIFFCQNLLFMAQAVRKWNNIRGSPSSIFQKMGPNIAIFDLLKYGVNGKTVTCLPLGGNLDNF